jgi:hypothetical protein
VPPQVLTLQVARQAVSQRMVPFLQAQRQG